MAIKDFLNKIAPKDSGPDEMLETGTKDKVLDSLRREEIKFDESEEKEFLKEKLRDRKKQLLRKNVFGVKDEVQDKVDIMNPKVNVNKSSVNLMKQKNLMKQTSLLNDENRVMTKGSNILNQKNLVSGRKNILKNSRIKFL